MKFRIPTGQAVHVEAPSGAYDVQPFVTHFGSGRGAQVLAHVTAVGQKDQHGQPELCHLSRSFATLEEAQDAFTRGFEVGQPDTAPETRANQILRVLRRASGVVARP